MKEFLIEKTSEGNYLSVAIGEFYNKEGEMDHQYKIGMGVNLKI